MPRPTILRFTPYAWAKMHFFCHAGDTEVGAFGITRPDDLLLVEDVVLVKQRVSVVTVQFDDESVADFFDRQIDKGRKPEGFARLWCHTHPGNSPNPSGTDEETFHRVFGKCDWAVMFILANGGNTFARLRFNTGPGGEMNVPVRVDFNEPFKGSERAEWGEEYRKQVISNGSFGWFAKSGEQAGLDADGGLMDRFPIREGMGAVAAADDRKCPCERWPYEFDPEDFANFVEGQ
jgi:hypothetical protein